MGNERCRVAVSRNMSKVKVSVQETYFCSTHIRCRNTDINSSTSRTRSQSTPDRSDNRTVNAVGTLYTAVLNGYPKKKRVRSLKKDMDPHCMRLGDFHILDDSSHNTRKCDHGFESILSRISRARQISSYTRRSNQTIHI